MAEQQSTHPGQGELFEALAATITGRRSIKQFAALPVPRALIERMIEAAVWAPNHRLTEPWRFYVLDGASREQVGALAAASTREKTLAAGASAEVAERKAAEAAAAWSSVPALLYVTVMSDNNPEIDLENYGATCCAVQNVMLLAHAAGLGTSWSSGAVAAAEGLKQLAGAGPNERMVGLVRIGYPDPRTMLPSGRRAPGGHFTTWVDEG